MKTNKVIWLQEHPCNWQKAFDYDHERGKRIQRYDRVNAFHDSIAFTLSSFVLCLCALRAQRRSTLKITEFTQSPAKREVWRACRPKTPPRNWRDYFAI